MFIFYSDRRGCLTSLLISIAGSAVVIALLLLLNRCA